MFAFVFERFEIVLPDMVLAFPTPREIPFTEEKPFAIVVSVELEEIFVNVFPEIVITDKLPVAEPENTPLAKPEAPVP